VPVSACGLLGLYRKAFCGLLIVASAQTLGAQHAGSHLMPLAAAEICGALLLLGRRTQNPGLALLLLSFAGAQLLAGLQGEWPTRFAQYALSALLIVLLDRAFTAERATPAVATDKGLCAS
jgi:hypothetical protein